MDLVLRVMSDVHFRPVEFVAGRPQTVAETRQMEEVRSSWVKAARALYQTHRPAVEVKVAWLSLANRYLIAAQTSVYLDQRNRSVHMTHHQAALMYRNQSSEWEEACYIAHAEFVRQRNGRRRFPMH